MMKKTTRRKFLEAIVAGAFFFNLLGCENIARETNKQEIKQEKQESENKKAKIVLSSRYPITNFGFYDDGIAYTIIKSAGNSVGDFIADEDRKIFSAPLNSETIHYKEQEKNKSRIILDAGNSIQFMYPSNNGFYVIANNQAKKYTRTLGGLFVEENINNIDISFDFYKGEYYFKVNGSPEEVKTRDRIRAELNEKLGKIGINNSSQIQVKDGEVRVLYLDIYDDKKEKSYRLVVETLMKEKLGDLYDKIKRAYEH